MDTGICKIQLLNFSQDVTFIKRIRVLFQWINCKFESTRLAETSYCRFIGVGDGKYIEITTKKSYYNAKIGVKGRAKLKCPKENSYSAYCSLLLVYLWTEHNLRF